MSGDIIRGETEPQTAGVVRPFRGANVAMAVVAVVWVAVLVTCAVCIAAAFGAPAPADVDVPEIGWPGW